MAIFDFPRINFSGDADINVPTINNSYYFPLTVYDQMRSEPFLPPRLYFSNESKIPVGTGINPPVQKDPINGFVYIEIAPVSDIPTLRKWCMTKLNSPDSIDLAYKPYYDAAVTDLGQQNQTTFDGNCPGYWNMYGDMGVYMKNVKVTNLSAFDGKQVTQMKQGDANLSEAAGYLLNASFDMDTTPGSGRTTGLMVETISSQSIYANIFCSNVNLFNTDNPDEVYMQGNPSRFAALTYGTWRVVNWWPPMSGSGRFCGALTFEDNPDLESSTMVSFMKEQIASVGGQRGKLIGVFISYALLHVFENRYDQDYYTKNGTTPNPARASTVGSITPLYEGDMQTGIMGRNLLAYNMAPVYTNSTKTGRNIPLCLTSAIANLKVYADDLAIFSVDMGNTWPEEMSPPYNDPNFQPPLPLPSITFETAAIGNFDFGLDLGNTANPFYSIAVNPTDNPLSSVYAQGCVFDTVLTDSAVISQLQNQRIAVYFNSAQILQEADLMLTSDQKALYTNQFDQASLGYYVNNENREPCKMRVLRRGMPVSEPTEVLMYKMTVPEAGNDPLGAFEAPVTMYLTDNMVLDLAGNTQKLTNNAIYYFVFPGQYNPVGSPNTQIPDFTNANTNLYTIMDSGSFVIMRVHPTKDYKQYTDPTHPNYAPPTWQVVYDEVFKLYDVVYPIMAEIHPFTQDVWDNGTIKGYVLQRIQMPWWNNIQYMPRSRELSASQQELLTAWAKTPNQTQS